MVGEDETWPIRASRVYVVLGSADFLARRRREGRVTPGPSVNLLVEEPQTWEPRSSSGNLPPPLPASCWASTRSTSPMSNPLRRRPEPVWPHLVTRWMRLDSMMRSSCSARAMPWYWERSWTRPCNPGSKLPERCSRNGFSFPTTLGIGPRFLHSTGQLHKGGPDCHVMVQVVAGSDDFDLSVPGESFTFGQLKHAQADGDLAALHTAGKRAVRVSVKELFDLA